MMILEKHKQSDKIKQENQFFLELNSKKKKEKQ